MEILDELKNEQLDYIFNEEEEDDIDIEKYANGLIYRWYCKTPELYNLCDNDNYYGSTVDIDDRISEHKWAWNNPNKRQYKYKVYRIIRENGGFDNWEFQIVEFYKCNSRKELELREKHYIKTFKPTLNTTVPRRTWREYREDNKEKYDAKKEEFNKRQREKRANRTEEEIEAERIYNRERYLKKRDDRLDKAKGYYQDNKEEKKQKSNERYHKKKDEINQQQRDKYANLTEEERKKYNDKNKQRKANLSEEEKERRRKKEEAHRGQKINCPHCNKVMRRDSMTKHIKRIHPEFVEKK